MKTSILSEVAFVQHLPLCKKLLFIGFAAVSPIADLRFHLLHLPGPELMQYKEISNVNDAHLVIFPPGLIDNALGGKRQVFHVKFVH